MTTDSNRLKSATAAPPTGLGYLVSQYPAISHTFILREVRSLRQLGFGLHVASINGPDREPAGLTPEEREEASSTFYVKACGTATALGAHLRGIFTHGPRRYFGALAYALSLADGAPRSLLWHAFYFTEALLLAVWQRRQGITHLHVHFATAASTVGLILHRLTGIPFSLTVHGPDEFYDAGHYRLTEKVEASAFVTCIGAYARSQVMKLSAPVHWGRFEIAPLGIDPEAFVPRPQPEAGVFTLLCVGRLVAAKGQHVLVDAVQHLVAEGRRVLLILVGDGPDRPSLEAAVADAGLQVHVEFAGAVDQGRIRDYYRQAHAFVLASFAEGIPVVLMEAMAMEIPCVSTRITGIPELIRDGEDGLLVPAADVEALAAAIARLQDDPDEARRLGGNGRRRVCDSYHLPRNIERLASIFTRRIQSCAA